MSELQNALNVLNKRFGNSYIEYAGKSLCDDYRRRSFGIFALDLATGGGIPERKIVTLAGKYSAGKSTTSMCVINSFQKDKGKVALIDTEGSFDEFWAKRFGVDKETLLISSPETIEQVSDTIEPILMSGELDLIIFDSVAATPTKKELEESADKKSMGGKATEVGLLVRKMRARLNQNKKIKTSILIINQLRDKVSGWGGAEYMSGGTQLHNQSDIIIYLRRGEWIGEVKEPTGNKINFRVVKNKTSPPLKTGSFDLYFDGHIDNKKSLFEEAVRQGIVSKRGGWFFYKKEKNKKQGLNKFVTTLSEKEIEEIKAEVLNGE